MPPRRARRPLGAPSSAGSLTAARAPSPWALTAALGAAATIALWGASCVLGGFTQVDGVAADAGDEGDATPEAGGCTHATYPAPPLEASDGGATELVVAVRSIKLGEVPEGDPLGYDLDLQCTCQGDGPTCRPLVEGDKACDGPDGRDNASTGIFGLLTSAFGSSGFGSTFFSNGAEQGGWSLLLRVRDYNGEPNDARVRLDWYVTTRFTVMGMPATPLWDGQDRWPISSACLTSSDIEAPLYSDLNAYVTDSVLVAGLPKAAFTVAGSVSTMSIALSGGFVTARIEAMPGVGDGYVLRDGLIVARWASDEVFKSISSYRNESGAPYCKSSLFYSTGRAQLCKSADILVSPGSPTSPCDALSFGIGFESHPAALGDVFDPPAPTPGCVGDDDPATDSCFAEP